MNDKQAFVTELARQEVVEGNDPTSATVGAALGWEFDRTSQTLGGLESSGVVNTTMATRRNGDTHLDDWVNLTPAGRAQAQALSRDNDSAPPSEPADRWSRIDAPVLSELARAAEGDEGVARIDVIAGRHDLRARDVIKSVDTLKRTGFVDAQLGPDNGGEYSFINLTERGLRATSLWPTPDSALDRMVAALEAIVDNTEQDEDTRSRARKILDGIGGAGRQIGIDLTTAILTGRLPGAS